METMHRLVQRQLKRHFGDQFTIPEAWRGFVEAVSDAYRESDVDRAMVERSLELSSQELLQANSEMRAVVQAIPDLLFRLDDRGTILDFKAGATSELLLLHREFFGKRIQDIPLKHISDQFHQGIQRVLRERTLVNLEYSLTLQGQVSFFEARLLPLLDTQIVAIIQNVTERKRAEAVQARQARHAPLRADVNQTFALGGATLRQILQSCSEAMVRHLDAAFARIWTLNAKENVLELQASAGRYTHLDGAHARIPLGAFKIGLIAQERKPHFTNDVVHDPRVSDPEWARREGMIAFAGYPLVVEDRLVGVLGIFTRHELGEDTLEALGSIAFAMAQGIERKRAEEELRHTVSLLQSTFNSTADGILVVDRMGRIISFNERFLSLWQIPKSILGARDDEAAIAHVLSQIKNPEAFVQKVRELYADAGAESFDVLEFKDGRVFERYSCPQRLDGTPIGRVWSFRDVTQRQRSEEELRWKTAFLEAQVDSSLDGILVVDSHGKKILQNQRLIQLFEVPAQLVADEDDAKLLRHVTNQTRNPKQFIERVAHLYAHPDEVGRDEVELIDGTVIDRYSSPVQDKSGKYYGRIWTFRNITQRKQAEESLLKLSGVVEQTADSVLITNFEGIIEYVNPSFEAMTGYTKEDIIAKNPRVLKSGRHEKQFYTDLWNTILAGKVFYGTLINRKKNGELYYAEKTITPIKDACGNITHFVSTEKDITERRELEAQLRQSQKMEAFGQLAAGVAHDFNNILTVIMGNASLLKMGRLSPANQVSATAEISRAGERAANLTRQLLTFSRRQLMQSKDLDLNDVVANITKMLQRLIGEHIALETHYAPGGAPVHADPSMMEQVLMNLAVNSRDAMPKGGRLILQTATTVVDLNQIKTRPHARAGRFVRLSISDTGEGIAPENLPHIFEPFFTTKGIGKGTGLGLATVFGIAAQHHGWIEVESQPDSGTTFHIYLPRLTKEAASLAESDVVRTAPGGTETILLVEDEEPVRQLMHDVLAGHGYRIHTATSGVHALEVWKEHRDSIDLLVTDMVMPEGINGRELADRLRVEKPDLRIIYCSGYTDDMLGKDSPLRNNENFLEKPFEPNKLLERVRLCVDAKR